MIGLVSGVVLVLGFGAVLCLVVAGRRRVLSRVEQARRQADDDASRMDAVLATASDAIITVNDCGMIERANPATRHVFGYAPEELIGERIERLMPAAESAQHHMHMRNFLVADRGQAHGAMREVTGVRKDGSPVPLDILVTHRQIAGRTVFTGILRDVSERRRMVAELEEHARLLADQVEALDRSNAELERFASVASHDLQEPLRKVVGYAVALRADYGDQLDEQARRYIDCAVDGARRMQRLIDDLLSLSRFCKERMEVADCDTAVIVRDVLDDLEVAIRESGADVEIGELPIVPGDSTHLHQVFQNLLVNAVKYRGTEPPRIRVTAQRQGPDWCFTIRDNGIGFEQRYAEQIFGMFQRLVSRSDYEGTGIGLALVAKIVANHGGQIWATSAPGKGTSIEFMLPADRRSPGRSGLPPQRLPLRTAEFR